MSGLVLPGWFCTCGVFNGEARTSLDACRACGYPPPDPYRTPDPVPPPPPDQPEKPHAPLAPAPELVTCPRCSGTGRVEPFPPLAIHIGLVTV
jgi:hypothetical protein